MLLEAACIAYTSLGQVSALVASFTISTAQAATVNTNFDDILAVARKFASKDGKAFCSILFQ